MGSSDDQECDDGKRKKTTTTEELHALANFTRWLHFLSSPWLFEMCAATTEKNISFETMNVLCERALETFLRAMCIQFDW